MASNEGAVALSNSQSLRWLDVRCNTIGKKGIEALKQNTRLDALYAFPQRDDNVKHAS